jgi:hypothetical protein
MVMMFLQKKSKVRGFSIGAKDSLMLKLAYLFMYK